ncbi:TPA: hypothetical protein N0F65_006910 [Lagenidium giganteum]|uniref:Uncharacterized protein n=1 Tax=Lagenidium giganteum TaxID=4803 RepID=A0AAV2ZKB1_9STRA|nr:TPA: hypothetical protein N0F65_006910 [Lagenidium giganteum]
MPESILEGIKSPREHLGMRAAEGDPSSRNYILHRLYLRQEFKECLRVIEDVLKKHQGLSEYPIYVKAMILRHSGRIQESLQLFQAATCLNPDNKENLKQVGRTLYLLGRHTAAIEVYEEILTLGRVDDWEIYHSIGLCNMYLKEYEKAIENFQQANSINRHDATFLQLGKVHTLREDFKAAIGVYLEALEFSPENPEILTTLGLLYLRIGENFRAFDYLGNSLTHDPRNPKTILAAGSIIQDHGDMDVALVKYRVAAVQTPNSAQLWNNIGMCFFGKQRYVASVACLKRALYLDPFEWITSYNLGLVHLNTGQYASAFHFFSAAINLKPDFASSYMYLAITLGRLDDFENACSAFEKAIEMERDHLFHLNFAITLYNNDEMERAKVQFDRFEELFEALDEEARNADPEVIEQRQTLLNVLCEAIAQRLDDRIDRWRQICTQFFYDQDVDAKRVLEYFESDKLDQIIIEAQATPESEVEATFMETITFLGLRRCMTPDHDAHFSATIEKFERVKNEVRGTYHRDIAQKKYTEFEAHAGAQMEGKHYELWQDQTGRNQLLLRVDERYVRTLDIRQHMIKRTEAFVKENVGNIGTHPFLAGLREALKWNLTSSTVVAWRFSDAVFVESGGTAFSTAALSLLANVFNFGHYVSAGDDDEEAKPPAKNIVKYRVWHIDPYMSDNDIRELLKVFPAPTKLQSRPTGTKRPTEVFRMNIHGKHDEAEPFFQRWCVIL